VLIGDESSSGLLMELEKILNVRELARTLIKVLIPNFVHKVAG